jgi:hypothetical protein
MKHQYCTTLNGMQFCEEMKAKVWSKAKIVKGKDPAQIRKDKFGNDIHYNKYGNINSENGWEIDHSKPKAKKGTDHINNLQPLQWNENRLKSDIYPYTQEKRKLLKKK